MGVPAPAAPPVRERQAHLEVTLAILLGTRGADLIALDVFAPGTDAATKRVGK